MRILAEQLALRPVAAEANHDDPAGFDADHGAFSELGVTDLFAQAEARHILLRARATDPYGSGRIPRTQPARRRTGPGGEPLAEAGRAPGPLLLAIGEMGGDLSQEAARDRVPVRAEDRPLPCAGDVQVAL